MDIFKRSDVVGTSFCRVSADDMVLNPIIDVLSIITHGGCNLRGENHIIIYTNLKHCLYSGREF